MTDTKERFIVLRGGPGDGAWIAPPIRGGWYPVPLWPVEQIRISDKPSLVNPKFEIQTADYRATGRFHQGREIFEYVPPHERKLK